MLSSSVPNFFRQYFVCYFRITKRNKHMHNFLSFDKYNIYINGIQNMF